MAKSRLNPELQLDVTFHLSRYDKKLGQPLSTEEKNAFIHRLIEQYGGVQCHALGTVVLTLPVEGVDEGLRFQLWIHDWE